VSLAFAVVAPFCVYAIARVLLGSDAAALGLAGVPPILYGAWVAVRRRTPDPIAVLSVIAFSVACVITAATGSEIALKLHEALITFAVGIGLLLGVLAGHPPPIARLARLEHPPARLDTAIGGLVGLFLVLHALAHLVLALTLSTDSYLVISRLVNWGSLVVAGLALSTYLRRLREGGPGRRAGAIH
jgi:hypothetical protein